MKVQSKILGKTSNGYVTTVTGYRRRQLGLNSQQGL